MEFTKKKIVEFLHERRSYIREKLGWREIQDCFYGDDELAEIFPGKNLEYCKMYMYDIAYGDCQFGIKYSNESGTYYMFIGANSSWAPPQRVGVGKAVDGKIYLIVENMPDNSCCLTFREVPEEYINKNECAFRPKTYINIVSAIGFAKSEEVTDEDLKCFEIACEGLEAFKALMAEANK